MNDRCHLNSCEKIIYNQLKICDMFKNIGESKPRFFLVFSNIKLHTTINDTKQIIWFVIFVYNTDHYKTIDSHMDKI